MVRIPKKLEQRYEAQRQEDKLDDIEETLVEHGYMKATRKSRRKIKGKKPKVVNTQKGKTEKEQEQEEEAETE